MGGCVALVVSGILVGMKIKSANHPNRYETVQKGHLHFVIILSSRACSGAGKEREGRREARTRRWERRAGWVCSPDGGGGSGGGGGGRGRRIDLGPLTN